MPFSPTCSHSTQQDRRNRIAADIETNEACPDRETSPTDLDKLEEYNPNTPRIRSPKQPGKINARKKKGFRKKSKETDVSVQPTGKWIRRISQSESAISFSYVITHFLPQCIAFNQSALRHEQLK